MTAAAAQGTSSASANSIASSWVLDAARLPFQQIPLHGEIDGIEFKPVVAEITFMRSGATSGAKSGVDEISFKDGGGRQIDVTVYNAIKFENVIYSQTALSPPKGLPTVGVVVDLRNLSRGDFAIRLSLGKFSDAKTQPVYVVLRLDRDNWLEGYIHAQVHERVLF